MLVKYRYWIVNATLLVEMIINTAMRYFDQTIFVYGNIISLLLLATAVILTSRGVNKSLGILLFGLFASLLIDKIGFVTYHLQLNDVLFLAIWVAGTIIWHVRGRYCNEINRNSYILLLIFPIKLYSQNSLDLIGERYIFYIGDSITHFLLAAYLFRVLFRNYQLVPGLLFAATFNHLIDNISGDPWVLHMNEVYFMVWALAGLTWWELRKRFATTKQIKRQFDAPFLALNVFFVGYVVIEVLRYTFLF